MVVISAGIVNSSGRVILARQFMDINRVRIEGLLSAFPRLRDASVKKQATFLDAGSVRYVYQPMEDLFLVLITSLNSNIVEDLETLQVMAHVVTDSVGGRVEESMIEAKAFKIFFAFDEIIVVGKKECTNLDEVQKCLEMDSAAERIFLENQQRQMEAAKRTTKEQAMLLREKKMMGITRGGRDPYGGFGSDSVGPIGGFSGNTDMDYRSGAVHISSPNADWGNQMSHGEGTSWGAQPPRRTPQPGTGMTLGKGKGKNDRLELNLLSKVQKEIGVAAKPATATPTPAEFKSDAGAQENIVVSIEEKMAVELTRDGEVASMEVKGELALLIKETHCERVKLELGEMNSAYSFKAHAKINKSIFTSNGVLAMMDGKPFPVNQTITILRWRATEQEQPPVVFTCWPEIGRMTVEYELANSYDRVEELVVSIPLNGQGFVSATPTQGAADVEGESVVWVIPVCSAANREGSIDITIADSSMDCGDVLFPISVSFASSHSLAQVTVRRVVELETEMPVRFSEEVRLIADNYRVE
eukprot:gene7607-5367_t